MDPAISELASQLLKPLLIDILLPFATVFAAIFLPLQKSKLLGKDQRNANELISLSAALIFVAALTVIHMISFFLWLLITLSLILLSSTAIILLFGLKLRKIYKKITH
jgi:hypothetical protein